MTLYQRVAYLRAAGPELVEPKVGTGGPLGSTLFITPREWTYNTYAGPGVYETRDQGLVGLMAHDANSPWGYYENGGYRIVTKADGTMDAEPFLEAMARLCSYGYADEGLSQAQKVNVAKSRPLEMRCGHVSEFTMGCASGAGLSARRVHLLNVTNNNFYDDGHVAVEVQVNGEWVLADVPNDIWFRDAQGGRPGLGPLMAAGGPSQFNVDLLAPHRVGRCDYPNISGVFYETFFAGHQELMGWINRIYEVPGISVPGGISWGVPDHLSSYTSQITGYPGTGGTWTAMPLADWVALHY